MGIAPGRLHAVAAVPAVRPRGPDLAQPRPVRALGGARLGAAVVAAPSDRRPRRRPGLRGARHAGGHARRPEVVPPARLALPRSPRVPLDERGRGDDRAARPGRGDLGRAWRSPAKWLAARYNRDGFPLFDFDVYALAGDGCMMEGVSSEAASLAGHLRLSNLCWIYDSNRVTIEGHTGITFTEDVAARFLAYGWNVTTVGRRQRPRQRRPRVRTPSGPRPNGPRWSWSHSHIGYGSPVERTRRRPTASRSARTGCARPSASSACPRTRDFCVPEGSATGSPRASARAARGCGPPGRAASTAYRAPIPSWPTSSTACSAANCRTAGRRRCPTSRPTPRGWPPGTPPAQVLNALAQAVPWLLGGSADLDAVDEDAAHLRRRRGLPARRPRRAQPPLRRPRARRGGGRQRHGADASCGRTGRGS